MNPKEQESSRITILVVDDDPEVLRLVTGYLTKGNYNVLNAPSGSEALLESRKFEGEIQVLISDFQMPGMTGIDLATAMTTDRPELKVLLISGFTNGMLVLNEGWHFLAKPFVASQLLGMVDAIVTPHKKSRFV